MSTVQPPPELDPASRRIFSLAIELVDFSEMTDDMRRRTYGTEGANIIALTLAQLVRDASPQA